MTQKQKYILFEINEICPHLIDRFALSGDMPFMQKLLEKSARYTTVADASPPALEPWIQWYSAHTGLTYAQHGVFRLTEGAKAGHEDIWHALKKRGFKVMNFSSMNCRALDGEGDVFFPDPWSDQKAHPHTLNGLAHFISKHIREYTKPEDNMSLKEMVCVGYFLLRHGLSFETVSTTLSQLIKEKIKGQDYKYARVFILDLILSDVFAYYVGRYRPDFATFFVNSVAHIQHAYWRNFEPDKFSITEDNPIYADAIRQAYKRIDNITGRIMRLAEQYNMKIMMASALSQQPYVKEEATGGRKYYRPRDVNKLLGYLNIKPLSCDPVMTHQYILHFKDDTELLGAKQSLQNSFLKTGAEDKPLFTIVDARGGIIFDCHPRGDVPQNTMVHLANYGDMAFESLFYKINEMKSGFHHLEGIFLCEEGEVSMVKDSFSVEKIYDFILKLYQ